MDQVLDELMKVELFARTMQRNAQAEVNRLERLMYQNPKIQHARKMRDEAIAQATAFKIMGDYVSAQVTRITKEVV